MAIIKLNIETLTVMTATILSFIDLNVAYDGSEKSNTF